MSDLAEDLYDAGLAVKLAAMTGETPEEWDRAIAAWRYAGWPIDNLEAGVATGWTDAASERELAESSFTYAGHQLGDAFRELGAALMPRWLDRLQSKLSR